MKPLLLLLAVSMCLAAGPSSAQEPVEPIDIRADEVAYRFLSMDEIEISVTVTVQSSHGEDWHVESFFDICMGAAPPVRSPMNISVSTNSCGYDPDCNNPCQIEVSGGDVVWNNCNIWHTWTGVGCDPYDPSATCVPLEYCACGAQYVLVATVPYDGEEGEIFVATDVTYAVPEADETNNTCATPLYAPEPVEPIDLQADSVVCVFPGPGVLEVSAYFSVYSSHNSTQVYSSDIEMRLGTDQVYFTPLSIVVPNNDCGEDPDCNDPCWVEVQPGQLVWDYCSIWHSWVGAACDPYDPTHTCIPFDFCACGSQYVLVTTVPYEGEDEFVLVADSAELVIEADETNNSCTVMLAPVAVQPATWGAIKSFYHE